MGLLQKRVLDFLSSAQKIGGRVRMPMMGPLASIPNPKPPKNK